MGSRRCFAEDGIVLGYLGSGIEGPLPVAGVDGDGGFVLCGDMHKMGSNLNKEVYAEWTMDLGGKDWMMNVYS